MLSRVADSLFWLGRYLERAENYARFIEVNFNLSLELPAELKTQWEPLITATGDINLFLDKHSNFKRENVIHFLVFDTENTNSIVSSVKNARENARVVRENLAKETWEIINELYHYANRAIKRKLWEKDEHPAIFLKSVKEKTQTIHGQIVNTELRTIGWNFLNLGHFIERADKTSRILDLKYHVLLPSVAEVGSPIDFLHWAALLKSVSGYNAFRRLNGAIDPQNVVHFLMLERLFPRSILHCVVQAESCLHKISGTQGGYSNRAEKALGALRSELEFNDVQDIIKFGLHEYLDNTQIQLNNISNEIYEQYFRIRNNFAIEQQAQA